jgi:hypothetical protein
MNTNSKVILLLIALLLLSVSLNSKEIAPRTAFLKSALIPGWGELSQGNNSGYFMLAAEFLLWSSIFYFNEEEDLLLKESFNYAVKYAHIDPNADFDDEYLYHLTRYNSSGFNTGGYNSYIIAQAESIEDPEERLEFIENNIYPEDLFWEWDNEEHRRQYGIKRKDSTHFTDYAKAVTGAIIANHIISAINSIRISKKNKIDLKVSFNSELDPQLLINYKF